MNLSLIDSMIQLIGGLIGWFKTIDAPPMLWSPNDVSRYGDPDKSNSCKFSQPRFKMDRKIVSVRPRRDTISVKKNSTLSWFYIHRCYTEWLRYSKLVERSRNHAMMNSTWILWLTGERRDTSKRDYQIEQPIGLPKNQGIIDLWSIMWLALRGKPPKADTRFR